MKYAAGYLRVETQRRYCVKPVVSSASKSSQEGMGALCSNMEADFKGDITLKTFCLD